MEINRRSFVSLLPGLAFASSCVSTPTSPTQQPPPVSGPVPPTANYIKTGVNQTSHDIKLIDAIMSDRPILDPPLDRPPHSLWNDRFVKGFVTTEFAGLVFYIDNQQYDDLGVMQKMLKPNQRWGCLQVMRQQAFDFMNDQSTQLTLDFGKEEGAIPSSTPFLNINGRYNEKKFYWHCGHSGNFSWRCCYKSSASR